ncbi:hypothetical protein [Curtobacterium sp. Leaf261]|uniref:hypothetical protein n=1 Tax=Curtobacterium sp. Leaf261 TaxID=1736311 RepID=UPI0006F41BB9|nr:hypothetical protein [Curtobacterium sp. Leaf261]KQO62789.1 hypothetical protein ASF23_07545 [Curtobacterium sp. Leaf261]
MRPDPGPAPELGRERRAADRLSVFRWAILGVWATLLIVRVGLASWDPDANLSVLGSVQIASIVVGVVVVVSGLLHSWVLRRRRVDDALGAAVRRFDPTVRLVPAKPTPELRDAVTAEHPEIALADELLWGFGATEASLWQLDGLRAVRVLVIGWDRIVHVALEDGPTPDAAVVALHYIRPDDDGAVASFLVRRALGASRTLGHGQRIEQLVHDLAAERITH